MIFYHMISITCLWSIIKLGTIVNWSTNRWDGKQSIQMVDYQANDNYQSRRSIN